ncbi:hypothetical protein JCM10207_005449 [Rhodosporidiobolus poonsookiae]
MSIAPSTLHAAPIDPSLLGLPADTPSSSTPARRRPARSTTQQQRNLRVVDDGSDLSSLSSGEDDLEVGGGARKGFGWSKPGEGDDDEFVLPAEEDDDDDYAVEDSLLDLDDDGDLDLGSSSLPKGKMRVKKPPGGSSKKGKGKRRRGGKATLSKQQRRLQEAWKRKALEMGGEGDVLLRPQHNGRKTTMSLKCSRGEVCTACAARGEPCIWKDEGPIQTAAFGTVQARLTLNRREVDRLQRLALILTRRYTTREHASAQRENRSARPPPTLSDVIDAEAREAYDAEEAQWVHSDAAAANDSSPLEDAEALLSLATPTVKDPPAKDEEGNLLVVPPRQEGVEREIALALPVPPPSAGGSITLGGAATTSAPGPKDIPVHPSPRVIRPFGRPQLSRSATTSEAVPSLRVSIPAANGTPRARSSTSSGVPSALPRPDARPSSLHARAHTYSGSGPGVPVDPALVHVDERGFPAHVPFQTPYYGHTPHRPYGYVDGPYTPRPPYAPYHPPYAHDSPYPPPPHFPPLGPPPLPPPQRRPDPFYFYPVLPSPLLSPRSADHLAMTRHQMQVVQSQPAYLEARRRVHEERYERAVREERARQRRVEDEMKEVKQAEGAQKSEGGEAAADKAKDSPDDLARRALENLATFIAGGGTDAGPSGEPATGHAFASVEPYRPMARESDPMLTSAGPISAVDRRPSWFLVSPVQWTRGSPLLGSATLTATRRPSRPLLSLDSSVPLLSALRTPSAGALSAYPSGSAGGLSGRRGSTSTAGISFSPLRSARGLPSALALEEGLRPFNSLRADALDVSPRANGADDLFDARFEPQLERRLSEVDWSAFEPIMEERRLRGRPGAGSARASVASGRSGRRGGEMEGVEEEDAGWETDGKSSVGRRSVRSASGRSGAERSDKGEAEESEESDEGSAMEE